MRSWKSLKFVLFFRKVVGFQNSSNNFCEELRKVFKDLEQKELVLKQDVATRWNSTNDMLERIITCEEVVREVLSPRSVTLTRNGPMTRSGR